MLIKPSDVSNDGTGLVSGIPFARCSDPFPLQHNFNLQMKPRKLTADVFLYFTFDFEKFFLGENHSFPENAIISDPGGNKNNSII